MENRRAYINGSCCISAQKTFDRADLDLGRIHEEVRIQCIEPDYALLPAGTIGRRMNKLTKIGVTSAYYALQEAGVTQPDAILTATGLGCMTETEKFLLSILDNDEQLVNPTAFMQSTHNTLGGQIALMLQCKNYNFTYVHKGFAFESALLDGLMKITEGAENVLAGGFDEITERHFYITGRKDHWRKEQVRSIDLYKTKARGTIAGEGSAFFLLSHKPAGNTASWLADIEMIFHPKNPREVTQRISAFLHRNGLDTQGVDLLLSGRNGDSAVDPYFDEVEKQFDSRVGFFKHLCGEFSTAGAFALWLSDQTMRDGKVHATVWARGGNSNVVPKTILIYNQFRESDHSIYLIRNCRNTG